MVTSSVASAQTPLDTVHRKVTLVPAATPLTVEVGEVGEVIDADPLTIDQTPLPMAGGVAAMVKVEVLHKV
jgi:hypothetical protein